MAFTAALSDAVRVEDCLTPPLSVQAYIDLAWARHKLVLVVPWIVEFLRSDSKSGLGLKSRLRLGLRSRLGLGALTLTLE